MNSLIFTTNRIIIIFILVFFLSIYLKNMDSICKIICSFQLERLTRENAALTLKLANVNQTLVDEAPDS